MVVSYVHVHLKANACVRSCAGAATMPQLIEAIHIKVFDLNGFDHLAEPLKYGYEIETRWPLADGAGAGSGRVIT